MTDDGNVHAVNDTLKPVRGRAKVTDRESGKVLLEVAYEVPANAARRIGTVSWKGQGLLDIAYEQGGQKSSNWFLYGEPPFDYAQVRKWFGGLMK